MSAPSATAATILCDPVAETREWEFAEEAVDMNSYLATMSTPKSAIHRVDIDLDQRVRQLIQGDFEEGPEALMGDLQRQLRAGNQRLASHLAAVAASEQYGPEARSLALETLTAARVRSFEPMAAEVVRVALEGPNSRLQFAGIAAVGDLSRRNQVLFSRLIKEVVNSPAASASVKRAGAAFLRRRV